MQLGMIGLGRMGSNLVRRVLNDETHECVVYDADADAVQTVAGEGATGAGSVRELVEKLTAPRAIWVMVPAGKITDCVITELVETLEPGDTVIDGGNSYYRDDIARAERLAERGIRLLDCGTSGWVWGLERGYSLMIGGDADAVHPGRTDLRGPRARRRCGRSHPGARRCGHDCGERLPALRSQRRWSLREDGPQRFRVRDDGRDRRGPEHPA